MSVIFHMSAQIASRSAGRSAVAMAAYRSGERLTDERTGEVKYYRRDVKPETVILAPEHTPEWVHVRSRLWNEVEKIEKQNNSQLCREINIALPKLFSDDVQRRVLLDYCQEQFVDKGMVADIAIHRDDSNNPHAHVMLTMRPFDQEGEWLPKSKKEYVLDENGERIKLKSGNYKSIKVSTTDWDKDDKVELWRETWANALNRELERMGRPERVDHRSFERQGITDRLPTIHEGPTVREMEQRGLRTDRGELNRSVKEHNAVVVDLQTYRQEKAAYDHKTSEKAVSVRQDAESREKVGNQNSQDRRGGGQMDIIEKHPDVAYQVYSEQKARLDKEFGLYKRREDLVQQRDELTASVETDRSLKRGDKAHIRDRIEKLDKEISKIPEPSEIQLSMMRDQYKAVEGKIKEVFQVAEQRRAAARTNTDQELKQPEPVKSASPVMDLQKETLRKERDLLFNERLAAERSYNELNQQQETRERRLASLEKQIESLQPKTMWQRMTNSNKGQIERLQRERDALAKEIKDREGELRTAKHNFGKAHREYQERGSAFRSVSQLEHKDKQQQRQANKWTKERSR